MTVFETFQNKIGIPLSFLLKDEAMKHSASCELFSYEAFAKRAQRYTEIRLRKKTKHADALVSFEKLDQTEKNIVVSHFGNPAKSVNPLVEFFSINGEARLFFDSYRFSDGTSLSETQRQRYTINASVLDAAIRLQEQRILARKMRSGSSHGVSKSLVEDVEDFKNYLKTTYQQEHSLPASEKLLKKMKEYKAESYIVLVDGRNKNQNTAKLKDEEATALLEQLIGKHTNLDAEQIAGIFNLMAASLGWKKITSTTVLNYKKKTELFTHASRRGENSFRNEKAMQFKRKAPEKAYLYWTLDGWDVELLYQQRETDKKGHALTTYHNRITAVIVLDPVCKYPIGYAIGTHETPALIREAVKNAMKHTKELFGNYYMPHQIQTDRYGKGTLNGFYSAVSEKYTPARAKNAKSKVIEPYFLHLNKQCQLYNNWAGYGIKGKQEHQVNSDYLNKIKAQFPDQAGCIAQFESIMNQERSSKIEAFKKAFEALLPGERLILTTEQYLRQFGTPHTHTNRMRGEGLVATIGGKSYTFDSFDVNFRNLAYCDWLIKYNEEDLSCVLVENAKRDNAGRVTEVIGTHVFLLEQKHVNAMALAEASEDDFKNLARINQFNKELEKRITEHVVGNQQKVKQLVQREEVKELFYRPELNDTLSKLLITDSTGNHKNQRNKARAEKEIQLPTEKPFSLKKEEYIIIEDNIRESY